MTTLKLAPVSMEMLSAAVDAAGQDLQRYMASGSDEDRSQFLDVMASLTALWCQWAERYLRLGDQPPRVPDDLRAAFLTVNAAQNEIIGYAPGGLHDGS